MECKYQPKTKEDLVNLCHDDSIYLGDIDTSLITDMSYVFMDSARKDYSGIETWATSQVTDMHGMFERAKSFNQDISHWDVSKVKDMRMMFFGAENFNQDLKGWKLNSNVCRTNMFFNCPIEKKFKPVKHREKSTAR